MKIEKDLLELCTKNPKPHRRPTSAALVPKMPIFELDLPFSNPFQGKKVYRNRSFYSSYRDDRQTDSFPTRGGRFSGIEKVPPYKKF